jgi:hypothetical protein
MIRASGRQAIVLFFERDPSWRPDASERRESYQLFGIAIYRARRETGALTQIRSIFDDGEKSFPPSMTRTAEALLFFRLR